MVDVLSFEGWLEPNEMSLLSAILEPGIPAGEHRGELQEYINTIRMQRVKDGTITQAGEDPLLTFGRIKNKTREDKRYDESKRKMQPQTHRSSRQHSSRSCATCSRLARKTAD